MKVTHSKVKNQKKDKEAGKKKPGCPPELRIEDRVLIAFEYWREYRSYSQIGLDWEVSESTVCRPVHKRENILIKILSYSYRNRHKIFGLISNFIAGIYHYKLSV